MTVEDGAQRPDKETGNQCDPSGSQWGTAGECKLTKENAGKCSEIHGENNRRQKSSSRWLELEGDTKSHVVGGREKQSKVQVQQSSFAGKRDSERDRGDRYHGMRISDTGHRLGKGKTQRDLYGAPSDTENGPY